MNAPAKINNGNCNVNVLFACKDSIYKSIPNCDVYDINRNALTFDSNGVIVAHPPCRAWASLRHCAKPRVGEKELALLAINKIRTNGGVLEHPHRSTLWPVAGLPEPNSRDEFGGWTLIVNQHWFGHRAEKRTRLYIVGIEPKDIPDYSIRLDKPTHTVGLWSGRNRETCRPSISKREYEATPLEFANFLCEIAVRIQVAKKDAQLRAAV
jgi:hypothetical protein